LSESETREGKSFAKRRRNIYSSDDSGGDRVGRWEYIHWIPCSFHFIHIPDVKYAYDKEIQDQMADNPGDRSGIFGRSYADCCADRKHEVGLSKVYDNENR